MCSVKKKGKKYKTCILLLLLIVGLNCITNFQTINLDNQRCEDSEKGLCIGYEKGCVLIEGNVPIDSLYEQKAGIFNPRLESFNKDYNYKIRCGNIENSEDKMCEKTYPNGVKIIGYNHTGFTGIHENKLYINGLPAYDAALVKDQKTGKCVGGGYDRENMKYVTQQFPDASCYGILDGKSDTKDYFYFDRRNNEVGIISYTSIDRKQMQCQAHIQGNSAIYCQNVEIIDGQVHLIMMKKSRTISNKKLYKYNGHIRNYGVFLDGHFNAQNIGMATIGNTITCVTGNSSTLSSNQICANLTTIFQLEDDGVRPALLTQSDFLNQVPSGSRPQFLMFNNKKGNIWNAAIYAFITAAQTCPNRHFKGDVDGSAGVSTLAGADSLNITFAQENSADNCGEPASASADQLVLQQYDYLLFGANDDYYSNKRTTGIDCPDDGAICTAVSGSPITGASDVKKEFLQFQVNGEWQSITAIQYVTQTTSTLIDNLDRMQGFPYAYAGKDDSLTAVVSKGTYFTTTNEGVGTVCYFSGIWATVNTKGEGCIRFGVDSLANNTLINGQRALTTIRGYVLNMYAFALEDMDYIEQLGYHVNFTVKYSGSQLNTAPVPGTADQLNYIKYQTLIEAPGNAIGDTFALSTGLLHYKQNDIQNVFCLKKTASLTYTYMFNTTCEFYQGDKVIIIQNQPIEGHVTVESTGGSTLTNTDRNDYLGGVPYSGYYNGRAYRFGVQSQVYPVKTDIRNDICETISSTGERIQRNICVDFIGIYDDSGTFRRWFNAICQQCYNGELGGNTVIKTITTTKMLTKTEKGYYLKQYLINNQGQQVDEYDLQLTNQQSIIDSYGMEPNIHPLRYNLISGLIDEDSGKFEPSQGGMISLGLMNQIAFSGYNQTACLHFKKYFETQLYLDLECPMLSYETSLYRKQYFVYDAELDQYNLTYNSGSSSQYGSLNQSLVTYDSQGNKIEYTVFFMDMKPYTGIQNRQCHNIGFQTDDCAFEGQCYSGYFKDGVFYSYGQRFTGFAQQGGKRYRFFLGYLANGLLADEGGLYYKEGLLAGDGQIDLVDGFYFLNGKRHDTMKETNGCPRKSNMFNFDDGLPASGQYYCCRNGNNCEFLEYLNGLLANGYSDDKYYKDGRPFTGETEVDGKKTTFVEGVPEQRQRYQKEMSGSMIALTVFIGCVLVLLTFFIIWLIQKIKNVEKKKHLVQRNSSKKNDVVKQSDKDSRNKKSKTGEQDEEKKSKGGVQLSKAVNN